MRHNQRGDVYETRQLNIEVNTRSFMYAALLGCVGGDFVTYMKPYVPLRKSQDPVRDRE